jgi:hypothetical protein
MSKHPANPSPAVTTTAQQQPSRRGFVAATATLGSLAAAASLWASRKPGTQTAQASEVKTDADMQGGYYLSEHVKRYYQTTTL